MTRPKTTLLITNTQTKMKTRGNKKQKVTTSTAPRTIMPERGIKIDDVEQWLEEDIHALNWEVFVEPPIQAIAEFVTEFLTVANEDNFPLVKIKGVEVDFSENSINNCFNTEKVPKVEDEFIRYCQGRSERTILDEIIKSICYEGAEWQPGEALERRDLKYEAKVWMHFINSKLIPASHDSRVVWERAALVFCILEKKKFNVGKIIYGELINNLGLKKAPFYFPCMVTEICTRAGVTQTNPVAEESIPRANPINNSTMGRIRKNEGTELAGSDGEEGVEQDVIQVEDEEESKGEEKGEEKEEEMEEKKEEGPKSDKATPAQHNREKVATGKRKKIFEGGLSTVISQTTLGRGADMIMHSIQSIEEMMCQELQHFKNAASEVGEEKVALAEKLNNRLKKELGHEEAALKELVDAVNKMLKEHEEEKEENERWKDEIRSIKEEMEETKKKELQLWAYIKQRDKINDQNWESKFRTKNNIPEFPDILPPERIEAAPQDGAPSPQKQ